MAQYRIEDDSLKELQYNIIRSHSTGAGQPLAPVYVKAAMIARLATFLQGYSGVHKELVELLVHHQPGYLSLYSRTWKCWC